MSVPLNATAPSDDSTVSRLEDQIAWYDAKSGENQRRFKVLKGIQLISAAAIPVVASFNADPAIAAVLGGLIVVVEGFQQLNQYQQNWALYRSNAEALKHEAVIHGPAIVTTENTTYLVEPGWRLEPTVQGAVWLLSD